MMTFRNTFRLTHLKTNKSHACIKTPDQGTCQLHPKGFPSYTRRHPWLLRVREELRNAETVGFTHSQSDSSALHTHILLHSFMSLAFLIPLLLLYPLRLFMALFAFSYK